MAMRPFLAMTAAEIRKNIILPEKSAWMACHFSPYGRGLSNLPRFLPEGSLLMVDDITPLRGHDPEIITQQLIHCTESLNLQGILLDFQWPNDPEIAELVRCLSKSLPCPPAVSEAYADAAELPVFASPVPPSVPLREHLAKWEGREIWLDISTWGEDLLLSEEGCSASPISSWDLQESGFPDNTLHCHYKAELTENAARITLWRTWDDLSALLEEADSLGVKAAVGLYQELQSFME